MSRSLDAIPSKATAIDAQLWAVIIPIKELPLAKTRLAPPPGVAKAALALAMALDVAAATSASSTVGRVTVITNDAHAAAAMRASGAQVIPDLPDSGLNPALHHASELLREEGWANIAAISSDLPALTSAELDAALALIPQGSRGLVTDADGRGTVLLAARNVTLDPRYGAASSAAHQASGAMDISARVVGLKGLQRDVDTAKDLSEAVAIGVGPHTSEALGCARTDDQRKASR